MTHPLKKVTIDELQAALAQALHKLTGQDCDVALTSIDFQGLTMTEQRYHSQLSLQIAFDPSDDDEPPF